MYKDTIINIKDYKELTKGKLNLRKQYYLNKI